MKKAVDGLILRETPVGENDKLLTVLTAEEGRVFMTAKGARSMRSKVMPICRLFTYANLEYYEKNDRRWLSGGSVNDSFFGLNTDMEGFALAAYIVSVANEITGEGMEAEEVLRMTLNTLYCIEKKKKPYRQIKAVYELFAAVNSGFAPDLSGCGECGCSEQSAAPTANAAACTSEAFCSPPDGEVRYEHPQRKEMWLDVMNGRLLCGDCLKKQTGHGILPELDAYSARNILLPLDSSALKALRYVCSAPLSRIFAFCVKSEESMEFFCRGAETYLLNHLERSFDTLDFYRSVQV